jgi:predicted MFS family arabinose efflux permease
MPNAPACLSPVDWRTGFDHVRSDEQMNPWRGLGGLPRAVWVIFSVTLVNRMGTMVLPFLVLYLTRTIQLSAEQAGFVFVCYGAGAVLTAPLAGKLCDRWNARHVMAAALFLSGGVLLIYPLVSGFVTILTITILWAIVSEAFRPASLAILSEAVARDQRKAAFSLSRLAINLGMSIGPAVGGFLAVYSFTSLFIVDGATSLLAGLVLVSTPMRGGHQNDEPPHEPASPAPAGNLGALRDFRLVYLLATFVPVIMVFMQTQGAMPLFVVRDLQTSESAYGLLLTINTILVILLEVPLNLAMARWPHHLAMALGAMLCGVGFGALVFSRGIWSVALTMVVWTFGEMILFPSSSAQVADIAPAAQRGVYMGYYVMTFSLAFMLGPWLGLAVMEKFGANTLWLGTLVCGALSAVMMLFIRTANQRQAQAAEP